MSSHMSDIFHVTSDVRDPSVMCCEISDAQPLLVLYRRASALKILTDFRSQTVVCELRNTFISAHYFLRKNSQA